MSIGNILGALMVAAFLDYGYHVTFNIQLINMMVWLKLIILLKVFVGLGSTLLAAKNMIGFLASFIPLIVLVLLLFLEIGVALVQADVFCLLMLMFLNDSYALH